MTTSFSSFFGRLLVILAVLIFCIPVIVITGLIGVCGSVGGSNSLFHSDGAWLWFVVSGGVFIFMIWLLVKLSSTWKDDGQGRQSPRL